MAELASVQKMISRGHALFIEMGVVLGLTHLRDPSSGKPPGKMKSVLSRQLKDLKAGVNGVETGMIHPVLISQAQSHQ